MAPLRLQRGHGCSLRFLLLLAILACMRHAAEAEKSFGASGRGAAEGNEEKPALARNSFSLLGTEVHGTAERSKLQEEETSQQEIKARMTLEKAYHIFSA